MTHTNHVEGNLDDSHDTAHNAFKMSFVVVTLIICVTALEEKGQLESDQSVLISPWHASFMPPCAQCAAISRDVLVVLSVQCAVHGVSCCWPAYSDTMARLLHATVCTVCCNLS
jgi:hypothetical protein